MNDDVRLFEAHRRRLVALAYRMLGLRGEAEDVVQDAWLRWHSADRGKVMNPAGYLTRTVTHLCLDRMKSARARRETYVGPWLPEPVTGHDDLLFPGPETVTEWANDVSFAFMLALERLSPAERAAFLLHDVFGVAYAEVARALGRSEVACRQLASRARVHVRESRPSSPTSHDEAQRLVAAFMDALRRDDPSELAKLLAEDARYVADGGGAVPAATRPLLGRERVAKLLLGLRRRHGAPSASQVRAIPLNGSVGLLMLDDAGCVRQATLFEPNARGLLAAIYVVRNPAKLAWLSRLGTGPDRESGRGSAPPD